VRYVVFCRTRTLFSAIAERGGPRGAVVILRKHHPTGWTLHSFAVADVPWSDYATDYDSSFYISTGPEPVDQDDTKFTDREAGSLIAVTGGREVGNAIEQTELQVFAKQSDAKPLMGSLTRFLDGQCSRGVTLRGHPYPKIRVENTLIDGDFTFWADLETRTIEAIPTT
jgi:hypothetical protein